VHLLFCSIHCG